MWQIWRKQLKTKAEENTITNFNKSMDEFSSLKIAEERGVMHVKTGQKKLCKVTGREGRDGEKRDDLE